MKEHCGLMGVYNHSEAARMVYFGLYAQQHRGQESAGIAAWDGEEINDKRVIGLAAGNFTEQDFATLSGNFAIGHVSSRPGGARALRNAEPFVIKHKGIHLAAAHNGILTNSLKLKDSLESEGDVLRSDADSELFLHLIVRGLKTMPVEEAVVSAARRMKGAFSFLLMIQNKMIAVRDSLGFKPLALAKVGDCTVVASETCAFDLIEAEYIRDIEPGEIVVIEGSNIKSFNINEDLALAPKCKAHCIFEFVYFARPDSNIFGQNVYLVRKAMGAELAKEHPVKADFVMPFPDSGIYSAVGFAEQSGLPYEHAMIRNHYVGRTFIQPSQGMRDFSVRVKINPVRELIAGKAITILDDSIVRGTTMNTRVQKLRELGAKEIHCRISSPPVVAPCPYGVNFTTKGELIAVKKTHNEIRDFLGLDSLGHISLEGMLKTLKNPQDYCTACFGGKQPLELE